MFGKVLDTNLDILIEVFTKPLLEMKKRLKRFSAEFNDKSSCISFTKHYLFEFDIT